MDNLNVPAMGQQHRSNPMNILNSYSSHQGLPKIDQNTSANSLAAFEPYIGSGIPL